MENASLALKIAGGVLIAVIVLSLVVWGFRQFGILPEQQDASMTAEQLAKFNQEFEVYNKTKMYGVDVISCLNKVYNYNEKYVLEVGQANKLNDKNSEDTLDSLYVGTGKYGSEFQMNVYVHIDSPLTERIEGYRINENSGKEVQIFGTDISDEITLGGNEGIWKKNEEQLLFADSSKGAYTTFKSTDKLKDIKCGEEKSLESFNNMTGSGGSTVSEFLPEDSTKYYSLYGDKNNNSPLYNLLKYTDKNMKKTENNKNPNGVTDWTRIVWYTALYDFKTRTFKCTHLDIDVETGQVKNIAFREVPKK